MRDGSVHIATSGWHYGHWIGPFYPAATPRSSLLEYYAHHFDTVELNSTFYRLPEEATVMGWGEATPVGFVFSVKASRLITHVKKLKDPEAPLRVFLERLSALGDKLGPVLFQLPPRWNVNTERLGSFLAALPQGRRYAFEFRDPSWFCPEVYALLKGRNAAFCIYDLEGTECPRVVTADFVYIRLHGPAGRYAGSYSDEALSEWARFIRGRIKKGEVVFCYFDNDEAGYAAANALTLKRMVGQVR